MSYSWSSDPMSNFDFKEGTQTQTKWTKTSRRDMCVLVIRDMKDDEEPKLYHWTLSRLTKISN